MADDDASAAANCDGVPVDVGRVGLRVAAIFIILLASLIGALAPVLLANQERLRVPKYAFFVCKFVGTGVIATAWMHLLDPAIEALGDACVKQRWPTFAGYDWPLCIALMTIMVMFFVELLANYYSNDDGFGRAVSSDSDLDQAHNDLAMKKAGAQPKFHADNLEGAHPDALTGKTARDHDLGISQPQKRASQQKAISSQLTAIFILEFGVIFHSIFIGLALGTIDDDGLSVLIVLVFHQMFEGLGLGSRLGIATWPKGKAWVPFVLAVAFAISTPIGIAAGLGAKPDSAASQKLTNGIFDSISAGILTYTGLVELLAYEFLFNPSMRRASLKIQLFAYACVAFGVTIMAILAKWA